MEELHSLVYVSSAVEPVTEEKLLHLLERARQRNRDYEVTGVLLFDAGNFMQYIEGPKDGLIEVYRHIKRDPLHSGIIELCNEKPRERAFQGWAMGVRVFNFLEHASGKLLGQILDPDLSSISGATGAAGTLLRGFWSRGQGRMQPDGEV